MLPKKYYEKLERILELLDKKLNANENPIGYFPPICPKCQGYLSQKCASKLLVCLKCESEFQLYREEHAHH